MGNIEHDGWTLEDREWLTLVTLEVAGEFPDRAELVRRITAGYVPRGRYRGAVRALEQLMNSADAALRVARGR